MTAGDTFSALTPELILRLQKVSGNQAVLRLLRALHRPPPSPEPAEGATEPATGAAPGESSGVRTEGAGGSG
jgi:hypothetical protein